MTAHRDHHDQPVAPQAAQPQPHGETHRGTTEACMSVARWELIFCPIEVNRGSSKFLEAFENVSAE
jgi:hypothetical protein